jgi:chemotaxis signal transduction protein
VAPLPGASGALLGLVEFGGEPLPVLDLGRALGESGIAGGAPAVTVFAWIGAGAERQLVGLAVDEAIEVKRVSAEAAAAGEAPAADAPRVVDLEALGALA